MPDHRPVRPCRVVLATLLAAIPAAAQDSGVPALGGLDPVELCRGREVEGDAELSHTHFLYKYRFASEANLQAFQQDPERYAIQFGGACARMGPLSGRGSPDRFAVHDGRIYIFASEQCRDGFRQDPARFLPRDEPELQADAKAGSAGLALLQRAFAAHGGRAAVTGCKVLQLESRTTVKTGQGDRLDTWRLTASRDAIRVDQTWGDWHYSTILQEQSGCTVGNDGRVEPLHSTGARELQLQTLQQPLLLLARAAAPEAKVAAVGKGKAGDVEVDLLDLYCDGARTTIGLDAGGRVVLLRCRGRGPQLWFGEVQWTFTDFRQVGGLLLPFRAALDFDGKPQDKSLRQLHAVAVDAELADDFFAARRL